MEYYSPKNCHPPIFPEDQEQVPLSGKAQSRSSQLPFQPDQMGRRAGSCGWAPSPVLFPVHHQMGSPIPITAMLKVQVLILFSATSSAAFQRDIRFRARTQSPPVREATGLVPTVHEGANSHSPIMWPKAVTHQ